jgi:integrase
MATVALSDAFLRSIKPGKTRDEYWDAKVSGLCLRVTPNDVRTWTFRYRPKGSTSFKRLNLGSYPELSLAKARERAQENRVDVSGGSDPQGEIRARKEQSAKALTFDKLADAYLDRYAKVHKASWKQDELLLAVHVRPAWGGRNVEKITRADAAALLDNIAKTAPTSANRTQTVLSKVFNWAVDSDILPKNPIAQMKKRARETAKDRVLSPDEIRVLWQAIGNGRVYESVAAALRFVLLTGQRPGEVAGTAIAELAEIDNGARACLEIPADRMKARRAHVVPLAPMALQIVQEQLDRAVAGQSHVFPSTFAERGPIARHSMSQGLDRIIKSLRTDGDGKETVASLQGNPPTPHDFRRTVATGLAALGVLREDRLAVLAHAHGDVHGVHYDKYERLKEKRRALELWERHVAELIAPAPAIENVVKIGGRR